MAHSAPFVAKPEFQEPLGFPGELVDNWQAKAIDKMGELLGQLPLAARLSGLPASSAAPAPTSATISSAPRTPRTCRSGART